MNLLIKILYSKESYLKKILLLNKFGIETDSHKLMKHIINTHKNPIANSYLMMKYNGTKQGFFAITASIQADSGDLSKISQEREIDH